MASHDRIIPDRPPIAATKRERGKKQKRRESFVGEGPYGGGERGSSWSASPAAEGERRRRLAGCRGWGFEEV
jgi:hypothetical protein